MNAQNYIKDVEKEINKYCKKKKYNFNYNDVLNFYKMHLDGHYLDAQKIDVIFEFKNAIEYINNLNL